MLLLGQSFLQQGVGLFPAVLVLQSGNYHQLPVHLQAVFPVYLLFSGKHLVGHFLGLYAVLYVGIGFEHLTEAALVIGRFLKEEQIVAVVVHAAQLHGNAVDECQQVAEKCQCHQENLCPIGEVEAQQEHERQGAHNNIGQHSAQVIPPGIYLFEGAQRRSHQALSARSAQREVAPLVAAVFTDERQTKDAERHEAVARQQSGHQMTAFVDDDVQDKGHHSPHDGS